MKITDFGLARKIVEPDGPSSGLTGTQDILGTPNYMAPEQLTGKPVTAATDVYALGLVIYEMLTGVSPFVADGVGENAVQKMTRAPAPPSSKVHGLDAAYDEIILRCLHVDPAQHPASVMEVAEALGAEEVPGAIPLPKRVHVVSHGNRSPIRALAAFVALAVLLVLIGVSWPAARSWLFSRFGTTGV